ncbi:MAG TPA: thioredoxin family protein [Acidobacteriaceae bacterium]
MRPTSRVVLSVFAAAIIAMFASAHIHAQAPAPQFHAAHIYNETSDAKKDISNALVLAQSTNRNVLLDFGANWCPDCQMLEVYLHQDPNSQLLEKNYILVHVDMGRMDKNLDVAYTFNVPIKKGIPALAVVQPSGRVVFSQTAGEFANMRSMQSSSVTEFLKMWRPKGH